MFSGRNPRRGNRCCRGCRGAARGGTGGDVSRGGRARGRAETRRGGMEGFARAAIASARSGVGRDARYGTRLASRGERARRMRARRGGRRASEDDGDPNGRNSRVEDGDRATHHHETANGALLRRARGWGRRRRGPGGPRRYSNWTRDDATWRREDSPVNPRPSARVRVGRRRGADCPTGTSVLAGGYARFGATYGRSGPGFEAGIRFRSMGSKWHVRNVKDGNHLSTFAFQIFGR